jgi:hypothetical protein
MVLLIAFSAIFPAAVVAEQRLEAQVIVDQAKTVLNGLEKTK